MITGELWCASLDASIAAGARSRSFCPVSLGYQRGSQAAARKVFHNLLYWSLLDRWPQIASRVRRNRWGSAMYHYLLVERFCRQRRLRMTARNQNRSPEKGASSSRSAFPEIHAEKNANSSSNDRDRMSDKRPAPRRPTSRIGLSAGFLQPMREFSADMFLERPAFSSQLIREPSKFV